MVNKEQLPILNGVHIGEHSFAAEQMIQEIQEKCIDKGFNFVVLRPCGEIPPEYFVTWAQFCAEHEIYLMFLYSIFYSETGERFTYLDAETVQKIKEVAGKYFLGDLLGEPGTHYTFKDKRYFARVRHMEYPVQNVKDMDEARNGYFDLLNRFISMDHAIGITDIGCVEQTMLTKYNMQAGVNIPIVEMMIGNPEMILSATRGCVKACDAKTWGVYVAHEWYGGRWHSDRLKQKRLGMTYYYAYLAGAPIFAIESGFEEITGYGEKYTEEHPYCKQYRDEMQKFNEFIKKDNRPEGGPKVKVAFVYGNLDGWSGVTAGGSLWGQLEDPAWGQGSPEYSWRILEDLEKPVGWYDTTNFGPIDFGGNMPMGMYDIIPAESSVEVMSQYELLIFMGWNTMTDTIYENLNAYVKQGGHLIMTAAHLNTNTERNGEWQPVHNGEVSDLFGCCLEGEFQSKSGMKFTRTGMYKEIPYPAPIDYREHGCDPFFVTGYARYALASLTGGKCSAILDDSFVPPLDEHSPIAMVEYQKGKGSTMLLTTKEYPGHGAIYPVYRMLVRNLLNHCNQNGDIKIYSSSKLKYAVYEGNVIYLLNTDYNQDLEVIIQWGEREVKYVLQSGELKWVELKG